MRRRSRRRRFSAMGLWLVALVCLMVATVWKFGWLPIEFGGTETGSLVGDPSDGTTDANFQPEQTTNSQLPVNTQTINADPIIFEAQTEPPPEGMTADGPQNFAGHRPRSRSGRSTGSLIAEKWDDPVAPSIPARFPAIPSKTGSVVPRVQKSQSEVQLQPNRGGIVQVGNKELEETQPAVKPASIPAQTGRSQSGDVNRTATAVPNSNVVESPIELNSIDQLIDQGDTVAAHRELSKIYWKQPKQRARIQKRIDSTARSIYFSPQPHYMEPYVIQPGDQLRNVAREYRLSWEYLAKLNQIDPRRIRAGQTLKVIKGPFSAVVDLNSFELTIHAHGYYVRRYLVGIGKDGRSPLGQFKVANKVSNPQYTDPEGRVIASDDPNNPLGERWIDIGDGFGIHGTIDPKSIGKDESRGCIRMHNSDVAEVYDLLDIGSEVLIRK